MITKFGIPPIKSQGIKTKLIPWIKNVLPSELNARWIEPFMGTGAVAFNLAMQEAVLCDTNPHLVNFYNAISNNTITVEIAKEYLEYEGNILLKKGEEHYYFIRERFNKMGNPLDFLFINRAGFNGMIRFNQKGYYNVPFCRKNQRFSQAYITKITNQIAWVKKIVQYKNFFFKNQDFEKTISESLETDIIYCDPPYIDRHADYYNGWSEKNEYDLFNALAKFKGKFILSTWHHNDYRENVYLKELWSDYSILTTEHFYHVGGKEENRKPMIEALITNFNQKDTFIKKEKLIQYSLI